MATKKRAKAKIKRKKPAKAAKKPVRKAPVKRTAPKAPKAAPKAPKAAPKAAKPASPPPPPGERIGVVTHYFGHLSVAVVKLEPGITLRVGDNIRIKGHTSDFGQRVESLQVGHSPVNEVGVNDDFGLKVTEHAREHDVVYRVK